MTPHCVREAACGRISSAAETSLISKPHTGLASVRVGPKATLLSPVNPGPAHSKWGRRARPLLTAEKRGWEWMADAGTMPNQAHGARYTQSCAQAWRRRPVRVVGECGDAYLHHVGSAVRAAPLPRTALQPLPAGVYGRTGAYPVGA